MTRQFRRILILPAAPLFCLLIALGCNQYGEVSPRAYEISTSLYSTCNREDAARVAAVKKVIADSLEDEAITPTEEAWLMEIVKKAEANDWATAMQDARTMMIEQVD